MSGFKKSCSMAGGSALLLASAILPLLAAGLEVPLQIVRFSERRQIELPLQANSRTPAAGARAKVSYKEGQARIELTWNRMKPAVLFGGDITCYVLWAVRRDGAAENLGELWVRPERDHDTLKFSTGLRSFALLVTAEPYYQVSRPSQWIILTSTGRPKPAVSTSPLSFSGFSEETPRLGLETLANVRYDGRTPLDLLQARKVYEIAGTLGALQYAPDVYREAQLSLKQATGISSRGARKGGQEFARRSVASSNDAIKITLRRKRAEALERMIASRKAEMARLTSELQQSREESRRVQEEAAEAVARIAREKDQAQEAVRSARQDLARIEREKAEADTARAQLQEETERLRREQSRLESEKQGLGKQIAGLSSDRDRLQQQLQSLARDREQLNDQLQSLAQEKEQILQDKARLEQRLQGALSQVADTRQSARGIILNLPDILFDLNQASLKPEARQVIAKLAGILLILPDLHLRVEGHTDSTGSPSYNQSLSLKRARSVYDFLAGEGISTERMAAAGYGEERPIAENSTAAGRKRNRRVEIIIGEGVVAEQKEGR